MVIIECIQETETVVPLISVLGGSHEDQSNPIKENITISSFAAHINTTTRVYRFIRLSGQMITTLDGGNSQCMAEHVTNQDNHNR